MLSLPYFERFPYLLKYTSDYGVLFLYECHNIYVLEISLARFILAHDREVRLRHGNLNDEVRACRNALLPAAFALRRMADSSVSYFSDLLQVPILLAGKTECINKVRDRVLLHE